MGEIVNLLNDLPRSVSEEVFETLVESGAMRIERIVSTGQATPEGEWYDQDEHEWVLVLQGQAGLLFEGEEVRVLEVGDAVNIPAHVRHRVEWTSVEEPTVWLAVFYR